MLYKQHKVQLSTCACGIWSHDFQLRSRLPSDCTIYTAELYAVYKAITIIAKQPGEFLILTDSLSVIRSLQNINLKSHYLLYWIYEIFTHIHPDKIKLEWVPSHMGIAGNESADAVARHALQLPSINPIPKSIREMRQRTHQIYREKWQERWRALPRELTSFKETLGDTAYADEPRRVQLPLTRIRLKVTALTHSHYFKKEPPKQCNQCKVRLTLEHLIIKCPVYKSERTQIRNYCKKMKIEPSLLNITSPPFPTKLLWEFLASTETINKI